MRASVRILIACVFAVVTLAQPGRAATVLFVLDASGSMWGRVDGEPKIDIARRVLGDLISELPADVRVGLEAYGHNRKDDCSDIEMLAPLGSERAALRQAIEGLSPKGMTPLTESIRLAAAQLREVEDATSIVVVSDGKETCDADPCAAAREASSAGTELRIHVVGFDVTPEEAAQLGCIAEGGKGRYFSASNAAELVTAFAAVKEEVSAPVPVPEASPPPPPPAAKGPRIVFRDDFEGEDLDPAWEVLSPDPDAYIVEDGQLLAIASLPTPAEQLTPTNVFRLTQPMPKGDWTATAEVVIDFQSPADRVYFGLYEDKENSLLNVLSAETGSCYSGGSYSHHLKATAQKTSRGQTTAKTQEIWRIPYCEDRGSLSDKLGSGQPIRLRLAKKGRTYTSAVRMMGVEGADWVELDKLTLLRPKGTLAIGNYRAAQAQGETSVQVDWVQIEAPE